MIVTALGVQMTIWQELVAAVREHGGSDEDIYRLATEEGRTTITEMAKLIMGKNGVDNKCAAEPKTETLAIAGYEFRQITYSDGSRLIELGEFEVDSDQSLASKLEVCKFVPHDRAANDQDSYNSWINQERFPFQQKGKKTVRLALINTGKDAQYEKDFAAMAQRVGRQMCDHAHGLTVVEKHPDLQRELYMIMFGARGLYEDEDPAVLVLGGNDLKRWLHYYYVGGHWDDNYWALVAG